MKDLIKALKENEKAFSRMSKEMQAKAREIGKPGNFEWWNDRWELQENHDLFVAHYTYRLRADYVENEYELCEIEQVNGSLAFVPPTRMFKDVLSCAPKRPNFAGYLYEDGILCANTVRCHYKNIETGSVRFDDVRSGEATIVRPTHVVFKKQ